jgi:hypothetical protein
MVELPECGFEWRQAASAEDCDGAQKGGRAARNHLIFCAHYDPHSLLDFPFKAIKSHGFVSIAESASTSGHLCKSFMLDVELRVFITKDFSNDGCAAKRA